MNKFPDALDKAVSEHKYSLLFATVSGAHLYGFPSPDSDFDLRGVHVYPVQELIGLDAPDETIELTQMRDGIELDLVTHDIRKFLLLLLKPNGYVLEQLYSPLIVHTTPAHNELKELAKGCITRRHSEHYLGFAQSQWRLFLKEEPPRIKPLLYVFRVILTGIHLMNTGEIVASLPALAQQFDLKFLDELIAFKQSTREQTHLDGNEMTFYESEYKRLLVLLNDAADRSSLPETESARTALDRFLKRVRLSS